MDLIQIIAGGGGVVAALMTIFQIAPIKINPWTAIARVIGKALNGAVIDKINQLGERMDNFDAELKSLKSISDEREAVACRTRILRFGDECLHDAKHSKEHFDQILRDIDVYEVYCKTHEDFENNQAVMTIDLIKRIYRERSIQHDFL